MKFLFILTTMFMVSCTMLLFYKVEVSSKDDEFYQPANKNILYIYIGTKKDDLDNFPVKPKHVKEKTIDDKIYIIYSYYSGLVEHVDVFIYNNEVEKYECLLFKDGP